MDNSDWISKKIDKYVIVNKVLGKGAFGTVYRGFFEEDQNKLVAVKLIAVKNISESDQMLKLIKREINMLQKLDNKNIVKLYDVARTPNNLYMFLEYCMDGDLKDYLKSKKNNTLSEPEATMFFKHIVEGFKDLHKNNIIHRDIKPANIMLHQGRAKISDFGFSRTVENGQAAHYTRLGSPLYMAPQILEGQPFSSKCDVWSVGIVFFEMLYGRSPWTGKNQVNLLENIKTQPLVFPNEPIRSEKVKHLIKNMLQLDENNRYGWPQVFEDDVVVGDRNKLEASLKLSQQQQDQLEKSITLNDAYIQTNLVANYLKNIDENSPEDSPMNKVATPNNKEVNENAQNEGQFDNQKAQQVVQKQQESEKNHKNIMKVNEYVLYERNISFFYNYVIQKIIRAYNSNILQIQGNLYFRVLFAICKCQNVNLEKVYALLKSNKNTFNETLWKFYQQSIEYSKSVKLLEQDIQHSKKFFGELLKKTKEVIEHTIKKEPTNDGLKAYQEILNDKFTQDNNFKVIYQQTINEFFSIIKPLINNTNQKDIIVIARYIIICQNPYNEFTNADYDFNKFYEELETIDIQVLKQFVKSKIQ